MVKRLLSSTLFRIIIAVIVGIGVGMVANTSVMNLVITVKYILGQLIIFMVPLIVLSFVSSSIARMGSIASKILTFSLGIAYASSFCAALMAMFIGYGVIPRLVVESAAQGARQLPEMIFELNIPPVMGVMTALILAIMVGLATVWVGARSVARLLDELQRMLLVLIDRVLIPILPIFIATNFCALSYEGSLTLQLPIFINIMGVVIAAHFVWLVILYGVAALSTLQNPIEVVRYYAPPYFTAIGTMSSAATLPVALRAAKRSPILKPKVVDFAIPIFSNIHLCGSIITEVFFVMTISKLLYGTLPDPSTMLLFISLLGIFAVGAPGVPGGTVIASLGIVVSILHFDEVGTALLLTIFALQDSFGTACNVVGDGALTMIVNRIDQDQSNPQKELQKSLS